MISVEVLEKEIKENKIKNSYIFCGGDEELIKDGVNEIIKPYLGDPFIDLNLIKFDGLTTGFQEIFNACETLPLMSDKKVVIVSRANFLKDKVDASNTKLYNEIKEYLKDVPSSTLLIMYYVFNDKRETPKKNKKILALDKITSVVYFEKLKKDRYYKKIEDVFKEAGGNIGKIEIRYFGERVQNNFDVIKREVEKLVCYVNGREIKREDINLLVPAKSEDDIFDLVDFISQKKMEKAIDILDELLFKADQHMLIISSIQGQFKKLYTIKVRKRQGKSIDDIAKDLKLPPFVCEKLLGLSNKFTEKQLEKLMKLCLETENKLKSSGVDKRMELEILLLKTLTVK